MPFQNDPWTALSLNYNQGYSLSPSDVLFASGASDQVQEAANASYLCQDVGSIDAEDNLEAEQGAISPHWSTDDVIDPPPSGDPVGPPLEAMEGRAVSPATESTVTIRNKGGRHGALPENVRKHAGDTRSNKTCCWPCKFTRGFVRRHLPVGEIRRTKLSVVVRA